MTDEKTAAAKPPPDVEFFEEWVDGRGRKHNVLHGSGAPGEPETVEQGNVRTGRKAPDHPANVDSAGLEVAETKRRQEKSRAQRAELFTELERQGDAADGDGTGSGPEPRRGEGASQLKPQRGR